MTVLGGNQKSQVEIEHIAYFVCVTVFKVLQYRTSLKGKADYIASISVTINGTSVLQHFKCSNMI